MELHRWQLVKKLQGLIKEMIAYDIPRMDLHHYLELIYRLNEPTRNYIKEGMLFPKYKSQIRIELINKYGVMNKIEEWLKWHLIS